MALSEGYGVLAGVPEGHGLERRRRGQTRHHHLLVRARGKLWDVAINTGDGFGASALLSAELVDAPAPGFEAVLTLDEGFHRLAADPASGALDLVRHPALSEPGVLRWRPATGGAVGNAMRRLMAGCSRVLAFGEPFSRRRGLHNVHCNQGDAPDSPWAAENGPWQDGGLLFAGPHPGAPVSLLLLRFAGQRLDGSAGSRS